MTIIYVDGDAPAHLSDIALVAFKRNMTVRVFTNGCRPVLPNGLPNIETFFVPRSSDAADDAIVKRITSADLCITNDILLAKRCLDIGARALSFYGDVLDLGNVHRSLRKKAVSETEAIGTIHYRRFGQFTTSGLLEKLDPILLSMAGMSHQARRLQILSRIKPANLETPAL